MEKTLKQVQGDIDQFVKLVKSRVGKTKCPHNRFNTQVNNPTIAKSEQSNKTSKRQKPNLFEERSDELFGYGTSF